jgi:modification methylase
VSRTPFDGPSRTVALYVGSSERMPQIADGSVALTVTSPPYFDSIDYDRHAIDSAQNFRTRTYSNGFADYPSFLHLLSRVFAEVHRATKAGGFLAIVVGDVLRDGLHIPLPSDLTTRLCAQGWLYHERITWHKVAGGIKRAGVTIQHPYAGYFRPNLMTEQILIFRKPGPSIFAGRTDVEKRGAQFPIDEIFVRELANDIWNIAPVPPGHLEHPCPFPEEIPYRLIRLYSYPGELVLEPFVGSGQTTKVALRTGRRAAGFDVIEQYVAYARRRLAEPLHVRPKQLVARFEKVGL